MPGKLVRFRADPSKVRISVRGLDETPLPNGKRIPRLYWVTVRSTTSAWQEIDSIYGEAIDTCPERAIIAALERAEALHCPGIDLGMEWTYEHPWLDEDVPELMEYQRLKRTICP